MWRWRSCCWWPQPRGCSRPCWPGCIASSPLAAGRRCAGLRSDRRSCIGLALALAALLILVDLMDATLLLGILALVVLLEWLAANMASCRAEAASGDDCAVKIFPATDLTADFHGWSEVLLFLLELVSDRAVLILARVGFHPSCFHPSSGRFLD